MIINTAGEYTLQYTATDACGNTTTVERDLVVMPPPRTVLYTDGTFIINERSSDIDANIALHGEATNVYESMETAAGHYSFANAGIRPWNSICSSILKVEVGSAISPTNISHWFNGFSNCTDMDLSLLDTSNVTLMDNVFQSCTSLTALDVTGFDTKNVLEMKSMFSGANMLSALDLSSFDTGKVERTGNMFSGATSLTTIYVSSSFVVEQVTSSNNMFSSCYGLVGGAGTTYSVNNPTDKTYAHIDGGVSDPGYFTAKS